MRAIFAAVVGLCVAGAGEPDRPTMEQLPAAAAREAPPSDRQLVDARAEFNRRYPGLLARGRTTAGAMLIADALVEAAVAEQDRAVKWLMLQEARRMAVAAGNAATLDRAIVLASATYEFDAVEEELRSLKEIPVRILAPPRAAALAEVAEKVGERAVGDGRRELAVIAQEIAVRAWQRAGMPDAATRAATRHEELITGSR